jgi:TolB-like protein
MSSDTAGTFKGRSIDAKEIGKELGVRYVLEGSVQRDQNRVRVNAQLIDAETGGHIWEPCSNRRSRSTLMTPLHWPAPPLPI